MFRERYKKYREHVSNRLREDTFPTLVLYAIFLSLVLLLIAFRGLILAFFVPETDVQPLSNNEAVIEESLNNQASPAE